MTKPFFRNWAKATRSKLPINELSQQMVQQLAEFLRARALRHILIYSAFGHEPDPGRLPEVYPATYYLPRIQGYRLSLHPLPCPLVRHPYGFLEPEEQAPTASPEVLEAVVVPGLCFDRAGYRLGYGKGYYDRFLGALPSSVLTVGFVPAALIVERLPRDPWDVRVGYLATENGVQPTAQTG
ncbi:MULTISPECIES: 5-formyltetrahydrofolate cyclo-ligase [unclassified Meiothermus]|uniref:5-formyltetrahydrofolate cyclo-ligase n=1 Tax=unclassified Meiothermus TaxID=370471 RepID=UPI000D7BF82E|nr:MULTISPECIES: 5-formyltetrahydrofolate cyclo-ligase [unclassified Meiothermus]PZA06532.1 5-formyltetrahydrofolate cyclo-ligase [Meiothermus sp. Pnk-1]RYM37208.1 5-formyltetrahydrofolate cyclo-ligase [Meiothermus sp. PNK-Is4]